MKHRSARLAAVTAARLILLLGLAWLPACSRSPALVELQGDIETHTVAIESSPSDVLNPQTYTSRSGEYSLSVDPTDRLGRGAGMYRVTKDGEEVWSGELPFTVWEAGITDSGVVGGYAYTGGRERLGEFLVVIIDPSGNLRLKRAAERQQSRFLHTSPNPLARGLIVDEANDHLVVRIADPDVNRRVETWWVYRLSTGVEVGKLQPESLMSDPEPARFIIDAKPVVGTPLTVLHWWRYDGRKRSVGTRFTLVDLQAKPVWALELSSDYEVPGDEAAEDQLRDLIREHGALVRVDQPGQFELYFAAESQRVTFSVEQAPDGDWSVSEVARAPYVLVPPAGKPLSIPERPLELLGELELGSTSDQAADSIRDVWDFTLDDRGRIAFVRRQGKTDDFVLVDSRGKLLHEIRVPIVDANKTHHTHLAWVGGNRFVVTRSEVGEEGKAKAWWLDVAIGGLEPIAGFDCPPVESIAGAGDGGFVVLGTMSYRYTMTESLSGFGSRGRLNWTVGNGQLGEDELLFSPQDVTVTTTGEIAVLDVIRNTIQIFDRGGNFRRVIDLEKMWGREPNYLSGIAADTEGGFLIHDFDGSPPFVRVRQDGSMRSGFRPRYPDGRTFYSRGGVQVDAEGRLWTSDGHALLRLNDAGIVDLILGGAPQADQLGKIAALTIDGRGLIYAVDRRTGSVHVFDADGRFLHVCRTKPTDFAEDLFFAPITVTDQGDVYLGAGSTAAIEPGAEPRYVHFSADGTRVGIKHLKTGQCYAQLGTDNFLALGYHEAALVNASGETIRQITRQPNGDWLSRLDAASVATDGSFALLSGIGPAVHIYNATGEPIRSVRLPQLVGHFPSIAYDGERLVTTGEGRVVIFDSTGSPVQTFEPVIGDRNETNNAPYWVPLLPPNREELILSDRESSRLWRFAIE